jgi:exopolysaccharide production protein ExoZ
VRTYCQRANTRDFLTNPIALEFGFGIILAIVFTRGRLPKKFATSALLLKLAGIVAGTLFAKSRGTNGLEPDIRFLAWGLLAAALVCSSLFIRERKSRAARILLHLGDASYSLYLTHGIVMTCYAKVIRTALVSNLPPLVWPLAAVAFSRAVGLGTYQCIELPYE